MPNCAFDLQLAILSVSSLIADTKAHIPDFKLGQKLFQFLRYGILKNCQPKIQKSLNLIAE